MSDCRNFTGESGLKEVDILPRSHFGSVTSNVPAQITIVTGPVQPHWGSGVSKSHEGRGTAGPPIIILVITTIIIIIVDL